MPQAPRRETIAIFALMPGYARRRTDRFIDGEDYVITCEGAEVGRCYLHTFSRNAQAWRWTIFVGWHVKRLVSKVPLAGYAATLDDATKECIRCFELMMAAGAVKLD